MESLAALVGLERKVELAIQANGLLTSGDRIVVAVSGGPDSVALFRCLVALRVRLELGCMCGPHRSWVQGYGK